MNPAIGVVLDRGGFDLTKVGGENDGGIAWWWLIVAFAVGAVGGFFGKDLIKRKK